MSKLNNILKEYTIYIDATSLMQGSMEFFKISLINVLNDNNKKIKVVDFTVSDLRKKQFTDHDRHAKKALNVLDYYRKRGLVEDIVSTGKDENNLLNVIYNNRTNDQNNICVITESEEQATLIVQSLMNDSYVDFDHEVVAIHLNNGPAIYNINLPKSKPKRKLIEEEPVITEEPTITEEPEVPISRPLRDKLVVSMVVDNSSSIQGERAKKLKEAIHQFSQLVNQSDIKHDLDYSVYGFDGFTYSIIKPFNEDLELSLFDKGGVQVLGKTMEKAMTDLMIQNHSYKKANIVTHRPWLIVLTDGDCYGSIEDVAQTLKKHLKDKELTYFPFSLSNYELEDSLEPLGKLKMFLKVKEDMFDDLLQFIFNTLETRIKTPKDEAMTLDKEQLSRIIAR